MNTQQIYQACFTGDVNSVKTSTIDHLDDHVFFFSIIRNRKEIVKYLIEELGMRPEKDTFLEAIRRNYVELSIYISLVIPFDYTCLRVALDNNCWELVEVMTECGLNILNSCISITTYGESIKRYIAYLQFREKKREGAAIKIQHWWRHTCGRKRYVENYFNNSY
jgi:hypothetical protein